MTYLVRLTAMVIVAISVTPLMVFPASVPSVGSVAPEFSLVSQESVPVSLKDYRGKWVVLYFYPKDFSSG